MARRNESKDIHITRIYDAPVKAVWDAWTDPKQAEKWWGPRGFTLTTHSKDLRPGGSWVYTMHGPDGVDYPNRAKYFEVEKYALLVYDHGANDERPPLFRVTVRFAELPDGRTKMDMTSTCASPAAAAEIRKFIKAANGTSTWDRLAEYLTHELQGKELFVINRTFDVSAERAFDAWTDPEQLAHWLPPPGFAMRFLRADIRQGASSFYVMTGGDGQSMHVRAQYVELKRPQRIVYLQQFCDEVERVIQPPFPGPWPQTLRTVVTFTPEGPDQTRVTLTMEPLETTAREELETFVAARSGMTQGWTASMDKLEASLPSL